jgi:hypothetical protein
MLNSQSLTPGSVEAAGIESFIMEYNRFSLKHQPLSANAGCSGLKNAEDGSVEGREESDLIFERNRAANGPHLNDD